MKEIERVHTFKRRERVYESFDGRQFLTEADCRRHEYDVKMHAFHQRRDVVFSNCSLAPFNGNENMEAHSYEWFRPLTEKAVDAANDTFLSNWSLNYSCVGHWCCVETDDYSDCWLTCILDDLDYVRRLCGELGIGDVSSIYI